MFAHRIFDHRLVGGDDKGGARREDEETDGLQGLDRRVGQAAIEVIDQDDELLDTRLVEKIVEGFPECVDLLGNIGRVAFTLRLQQAFHAFDGGFEIVLGGELCRIGEDAFQGADDGLNLIGRRNSGKGPLNIKGAQIYGRRIMG